MVKTENFEQVEIVAAAQLRDWLQKNYAQTESIWLITYKKEVTDKYVSNNEVLDELLCFGWIDGIKRKIDEQKVMQLISPRRVQHWSQTYKDRFARLEIKGRMTEVGRRSVNLSKSHGLWDYMNDVDQLIKSEDFVEHLEKYPNATKNFDAFGASCKRFMLRYIKLAKTQATRTKRLAQIALLASQNQKLPGS
ncbi:MAG: YdeI/OmpD-associated family protein [Flavobacterium sp.]|nr:YdeI/OmpD-associated family protein [Flavobacterium sp.]